MQGVPLGGAVMNPMHANFLTTPAGPRRPSLRRLAKWSAKRYSKTVEYR
jgi:hypothetical protein